MFFSKRNKRGIAYFVLLVIVIAYLPRVVSYLSDHDMPEITFVEVKKIEKKLAESNQIWRRNSKRQYSNAVKKNKRVYKAPPRKFDPNQYSESDWLALGLSKKQVAVILKFTERGVRSNEDLKKIYVLPKEVFDLLKDSTYYPKGDVYNREMDAFTEKDINELYIPLNSASEDEFQKIPGIGPYFASKIVEYREQLGGYVQKEQLMDISKMDPEKYQSIRNYIKLDPVDVRKININKASIDELKNHPYISYNVANSIVKMREQRGEYTELKEIMESVLIELPLYRQIEPYITIK